MKALLIALAVMLAEDAGVDPRLWCNIVREESGWDVDAVSPSGCVGLAQVNQEVWDWWPERPFDPEANMRMGLAILKFNLEYRRDPDLALPEQWARAVASYNLGHGRVNRLIAEHGDGWREALPEANRRYLEAVMNLEVTDAPNP